MVYGQAAIAVPVFQISAKAIIKPDIQAPEGRIWIQSEAISLDDDLKNLGKDDPLAMAIFNTLAHFSVDRVPAFRIKIVSDIPLASGLGSGAAVSAGVIRAVAGFLGQSLSDLETSELAYESEKFHHGTPSGIDNTVVSFGKAVYFEKGQKAEVFEVGRPFELIIADTGIESKTRLVVEDVRQAWKNDAIRYERIFKDIGIVSQEARKAMRLGQQEILGELMNRNQQLLSDMGVSSPELDQLVAAAISNGAIGAKLSGGGRGGNMIALAPNAHEDKVEEALRQAGAKRIIRTRVQ